MSRPLRIEYPGAFYHVMNRGLSRLDIVRGDKDRQAFLRVLGEGALLFGVAIHAYSLLDNHYHLLVETPRGNLARFMRHVNGVYTQRFNWRHRRDGPLFRGRYKAILVDKDSYLLELVRYIHLNPVRARITSSAAGHRWTSHAAYLGRRERPSWLKTDTVLRMLSRKGDPSVLDGFVREGVPRDLQQRLEGNHWPSLLGSEGFIGRFRERIRKWCGKPIPAVREYAERVSWERIGEAVCRHYGIEKGALLLARRGKGREPREAAVYLARRRGEMGYQEIAERLKIEPGSAATIYKRAEAKWGGRAKILNIINET